MINNFPKAVKRVLIRFGLGEIKRKLRELHKEYGIEVLYVNPAYTSQACSNCGYIDKESRKSRSEFKCKCCGKSLHVDANAFRNLLDRVRWGYLPQSLNLRCGINVHVEGYSDFTKHL